MMNKQARLHWACRRGMLELDLMLIPFLEQRYLQLTPAEQETFQSLLNCTDPELFSWLMGHEHSDNPEFTDLIKQIRHHAKHPT